MSKIITLLASLTAVISILLLSIAAVLIWTPESLLGILRIGIIAVCIITGMCMLIPVLIVVVSAIGSVVWKKQKNYGKT